VSVVTSAIGRIYYERQGAGDPLVLVHGNGQSLRCWDRMVALLTPTFDVLALDLPGHGESEVASRHLGINDYADGVVAVMDACSFPAATIVGASVGGQIATAMAASHANMVSRLVLCETNYRPEAWWIENWERVEARFALPIETPGVVRSLLRDPSDATLSRWNIDRSKTGARHMMSVMWAIREYDMTTDLAQVRAPALLVFGSDGPALGGRADLETDLGAGDVRGAVLSDSGHFPMHDVPAAFARLIVDHTQGPDEGDLT
jgi:3-oxoadipate enol-lactonase